MKSLTLETYLDAFKVYPSHAGITGGVVHNFLRESRVVYYPGVYYVEHYHNGKRCVIGGNYATNGRPKLTFGEMLDF